MDRQTSMVAVGLEVGPGLLQTFGIGHIYSGRVATGIGLMVSYWALQFVNALLMPFLIGWITAPLTFLAFMIFCPTNVLESRKR